MLKLLLLEDRRLNIEHNANLVELDNNATEVQIVLPSLYESINLLNGDFSYILKLHLEEMYQEVDLEKSVTGSNIVLKTLLTKEHLFTDGILRCSLSISNANITINSEVLLLKIKNTLTGGKAYSLGLVESYLNQMKDLVLEINTKNDDIETTERLRQENETTRQENETTRQENELDRNQSEITRSNVFKGLKSEVELLITDLEKTQSSLDRKLSDFLKELNYRTNPYIEIIADEYHNLVKNGTVKENETYTIKEVI